jgi:hypothetical protein
MIKSFLFEKISIIYLKWFFFKQYYINQIKLNNIRYKILFFKDISYKILFKILLYGIKTNITSLNTKIIVIHYE